MCDELLSKYRRRSNSLALFRPHSNFKEGNYRFRLGGVMMFAEFRVYVQFDESPDDGAITRMQDFIRACIGNLEGVSAVEVEPPKGSVQNPTERQLIVTGSTQLM
jgi:hypothetical protein